MSDKVYIGDGVYAAQEHGSIVLETEREQNGRNWIALEPEVFDCLLRYAQTIGWVK